MGAICIYPSKISRLVTYAHNHDRRPCKRWDTPEILDIDVHGWTPVRDRGMGCRQYTLSSNATTPESNKSDQANLHLGRVLKTEHILLWMADPLRRKRTRKGLLKTEQIHQLARDITYGNRGRFKGRSLEDITSSGNCTAL